MECDTELKTKLQTNDIEVSRLPNENTSENEEGASLGEGDTESVNGNKRDKLFSLVFVIIVCCSLCSFLVGQGANAGTSVYLEAKGLDTSLAGIGALVFSIAAAFARIVSGPLSDRKGRKPLMVIGTLVMLLGAVCPLFKNSGALLIVWRSFQGFGFSIVTTAAASAAADVLPKSRLGEGIGYYGLGQAISMSVGPALAIFLVSTNPPENFYVGISICSVLAFIFSLLCSYEKNPNTLPETSEYRVRYNRGEIGKMSAEGFNIIDSIFEPAALRGALPMMFIAVAFGFGIFFIGVFGTSIGIESPGLFFTIAAITMIAVRLAGSSFMDKAKPIYVMGLAVICAICVYCIFLYCQSVGLNAFTRIAFYASGLLYGISLGLALPINQTVSVKASPSSRWGAANGLFLLANDVSIGFASLVCGFTISAFGYGPTICGVIVCVAVSFFVALALYPNKR